MEFLWRRGRRACHGSSEIDYRESQFAMITRLHRFFIFIACLVFAGSASASLSKIQVEMDSYVVVSSTDRKTMTSWVKEFDKIRRAAQQLAGINDDQVLPLTIILLEKDEEFSELLSYYSSGYHDRQVLVMSVGMGQQPIIALSLENSGYDMDVKIRSAVAMWLLSSSGIAYDPWVVQGFLDLFSMAKIKKKEIVLGKSIKGYLRILEANRKAGLPRKFYLDQGTLEPGFAWVAMHYLLLGSSRRKGMAMISRYQQRIEAGTPREEAFAGIFGMSSARMDVLMQAYLEKDRFRAVKIPSAVGSHRASVHVEPAEAGLWQISVAQFILQQEGSDFERARRLLEEARTSLPGDPRVYENLWLYGAKTQQSALSHGALNTAMKLGSKNHTLRLQWCINLINQGIAKTGGFILEKEDALAAAADLRRQTGAQFGKILVHRLYAQLIPSIGEARPEDRRFLETGMELAYSPDPILQLGMGAWYWRNGQLSEAEAWVRRGRSHPNQIKFNQDYANWLQAQFAVQRQIIAIKKSLEEGDYDSAVSTRGEVQQTYVFMPFLRKELELIRIELANYSLTQRISQLFTQGEHESGKILMENLASGELSPGIRAILKKLLVKMDDAVKGTE